jgi:hypothetical protein
VRARFRFDTQGAAEVYGVEIVTALIHPQYFARRYAVMISSYATAFSIRAPLRWLRLLIVGFFRNRRTDQKNNSTRRVFQER